jgi:hypothetical protein
MIEIQRALLVELDARVAIDARVVVTAIVEERPCSRETICVLVENDIAFVFDELKCGQFRDRCMQSGIIPCTL